MVDSTSRLQAELAELRSALAGLADALSDLDRSCVVAIDALAARETPTTVYRRSDFAASRDEVFATLDRFRSQLTRVRAEAIRLHVDLEGRSLTDVAALIGRSRQFVTRLYRQASQG